MLPVLALVVFSLLSWSALASSASIPHDLPEPDTAGAGLMLKKCSGCHGVPHPDLHPASMWPSVVYRMQVRMQTKGQVPLSRDEMSLVIDYLQRHAAVIE